jgi:hypothetical protein
MPMMLTLHDYFVRLKLWSLVEAAEAAWIWAEAAVAAESSTSLTIKLPRVQDIPLP